MGKLSAERKGLDGTHKTLVDQVADLQAKMRREGSISFADKVLVVFHLRA